MDGKEADLHVRDWKFYAELVAFGYKPVTMEALLDGRISSPDIVTVFNKASSNPGTLLKMAKPSLVL